MTTDEVAYYVALARRLAQIPWIEIPDSGKPLDLKAIEKQAVLNAIEVCDGNVIKAARLLGMGKTTIYRRRKEYRKTP